MSKFAYKDESDNNDCGLCGKVLQMGRKHCE